jgi:hypothetical protein
MPREYEAIRDSLKKSGKSDKEAKSEAAAIFNKRHPNAPVTGKHEPKKGK